MLHECRKLREMLQLASAQSVKTRQKEKKRERDRETERERERERKGLLPEMQVSDSMSYLRSKSTCLCFFWPVPGLD